MKSEQSAHRENKRSTKNRQTNCLTIGFLVILSLLFILSNILLVFSFNIQRVVFNPETLTQSINDRLMSDHMIEKSLFTTAQNSDKVSTQTLDIGSLITTMSPENRAIVQQLLFPETFLYGLVSTSVDAFLLWADSDMQGLQFTWDMTPLKNRLAGEEGQEVLKIAARSLPDCTPEEMNDIITQMMADPSAPINSDRLCRFAEPYKDQQMQIFTTALNAVNGGISPSYTVTPIQEGVSSAGSTRLIRGILGFIQFYGRWGWVVSLSLLSLILIIGVRSLDTLSGWVGIPLLLSGILVLTSAVISRMWIFNRLNAILTTNLSPISADLSNSILKGVSGDILLPMMFHGIILLVIGGVSFVILVIRKIMKAK